MKARTIKTIAVCFAVIAVFSGITYALTSLTVFIEGTATQSIDFIVYSDAEMITPWTEGQLLNAGNTTYHAETFYIKNIGTTAIVVMPTCTFVEGEGSATWTPENVTIQDSAAVTLNITVNSEGYWKVAINFVSAKAEA